MYDAAAYTNSRTIVVGSLHEHIHATFNMLFEGNEGQMKAIVATVAIFTVSSSFTFTKGESAKMLWAGNKIRRKFAYTFILLILSNSLLKVLKDWILLLFVVIVTSVDCFILTIGTAVPSLRLNATLIHDSQHPTSITVRCKLM